MLNRLPQSVNRFAFAALIAGLCLPLAGSGAQLGRTFQAETVALPAQNLAVDSDGNVYVAVTPSCVVFKVTPDGANSIIAGNGIAGFRGDGGPAVSAELRGPAAVAVDAAGVLYIADTGNLRVRKVTRDGLISTVAGNGVIGTAGDGGPATAAQLRSPQGIALDTAGNLYIADPPNYRVRKVTPEGVISTIAGNGVQGTGGDDGPAVAAQLLNPIGLAVDRTGNLYIAGAGTYRIRKVTPDGTIRTVAGTGSPGFSGDAGPATAAQISNAVSIAVDKNGNLYIADPQNSRIRRVTPDGVIRTVAGNGAPGYSGDGGPATAAQMRTPLRLASDGVESLFILDSQTPGIRKVAGTGIIGTIPFTAPSTTVSTPPIAISQIQPGYTDEARQARVSGTVILDTTVRKDGTIQVHGVERGLGYGLDEAATAAASQWRFQPATRDGMPIDARMQIRISYGVPGATPSAAAPPPSIVPISTTPGALRPGYVAPYAIHSPAPAVSDSVMRKGIRGTVQLDVVVDETGKAAYITVSRSLDCELDEIAVKTVRTWKFEPARQDGKAETASVRANVNFVQILASGSSTPPPSAAQLKSPAGVAVDSAGNLYVANTGNARLRKVTPNGSISVLGRGTPGFWGDGGAAVTAEMRNPTDVIADSAGNIYVADTGNHRIRKITSLGVIATVIGKGTAGFSGDKGSAICAQLRGPAGIALDRTAAIYIADTGNNRIRKVTADGKIDTFAGNGTRGFGGDGGNAVSASLNAPSGVAVDAAGNLYIADTGNDRIRRVAPDGIISTVAGNGTAGFAGDGSAAVSAQLKSPSSIAVDPSGILYIADTGNSRIRKVSPDGRIGTAAGNGVAGYGGENGPAISAQLKSPWDVGLDAAGNLYIADTGNNLVRKVTPNGMITTVTGSAP